MAFDRQVSQKLSDLLGIQLAGMSPAVEGDETANPAEVGGFGAPRKASSTDFEAGAFEEAWLTIAHFT